MANQPAARNSNSDHPSQALFAPSCMLCTAISQKWGPCIEDFTRPGAGPATMQDLACTSEALSAVRWLAVTTRV
jgi:hypothetical protein